MSQIYQRKKRNGVLSNPFIVICMLILIGVVFNLFVSGDLQPPQESSVQAAEKPSVSAAPQQDPGDTPQDDTMPQDDTVSQDDMAPQGDTMPEAAAVAGAVTDLSRMENQVTHQLAESDSKEPYRILVNKETQVVTVYEKDASGNYTVPVRNMICSTGKSGNTPEGVHKITDKYRWRWLQGNVYGQYACRFQGSFLFHSVPYEQQAVETLKWEEFNKLGTPASEGCVRLRAVDAKWIYDNCNIGTEVEVVDGGVYAGAATQLQVEPLDEGTRWDPTDPNEGKTGPASRMSETEQSGSDNWEEN
ncbi:MAG: L,D-transpeptidase [Christensenellales bacterium]|jgi:lipoprotein-anchoring transpeptidase ErfK/SrfK